eukprot:3323333-Amphidinium_carterae.1
MVDAVELVCHICGKQFATRKGVASHKRMQHNIFPPLALRLYSSTCPSCGAELKSRNHLLQHLGNRLVCSMFVIANIDPMTYEDYKKNVHRLDVQNAAYTRTVIPRTGRIAIIDGVPQSQGVIAINPYEME